MATMDGRLVLLAELDRDARAMAVGHRLPKRHVTVEIVWVRCPLLWIGGLLVPFSSAGKIAVHSAVGAHFNHIDLARAATSLPMVRCYPKRRGPGVATLQHGDIEINLLQVVHIEAAVRHCRDRATWLPVTAQHHGSQVIAAHFARVLRIWL